MMYLPNKSDQEAEATKLMVELFNLVLPEKIAEEVVRKDVKLTYDPATGELVQIVMPFMTRSEVMTLTVDQGWVTEASVEDVKLLPGVRRALFRLHWRRLGRPRDRESGPERPGRVRAQQRGHCLVGKSRPHGFRQPLLEAGGPDSVEPVARP